VQSSIRSTDIEGRLGGEEIAIVMPITSKGSQRSLIFSKKLHEKISKKIYNAIPYLREDLFRMLREDRIADNTAVYDGFLYQLYLQNGIKPSVLREKHKNLKELVDAVEVKDSLYKFDGWHVTVSMGFVQLDEDRDTFSGEVYGIEDLLLKQADVNLALAKGNGKNQVVSSPYQDAAQIGNVENGGIDLTSASMNVQVKNGGAGIKFHIDPAKLEQMQRAPGFLPVIINIRPLPDLQQFLLETSKLTS